MIPSLPTTLRRAIYAAACFSILCLAVFGQAEFEGGRIETIDVTVDGAPAINGTGEAFIRTIREAVGETYAAVRVRDSLAQLYEQRDIELVEISALRLASGNVGLTYSIKRKARAKRVTLEIEPVTEGKVTEQELIYKLDLLDPGAVISDDALAKNATAILEYLREKGFLRARVTYEKKVEAANEIVVVFKISPGVPAKVESVQVNIDGFDSEKLEKRLKLNPGEIFTREAMNADAERIRTALIEEQFLAPTLNEPQPVYDGDTNSIALTYSGQAGPQVEVIVETEKGKLGTSAKQRLLPVAREGTIDYAAIIEGDRRLENHYQEQGYFFASVTPICAIVPEAQDVQKQDPLTPVPGESEAVCSSLSSADFADKKAVVKYKVDLDRRLKLNDIRLTGTTQFTVEEILPVLESQRANILGIIPIFGYGRGFTSNRILEQDAATIRSLLRELGYRDATVRTDLGVSPNGENLIVTFVVEEKLPTKVNEIAIKGNSAFASDELLKLLPAMANQNLSPARVRLGQRKLSEFYANAGYFDAKFDYSIDLSVPANETDPRVAKINYTVRTEGVPVYIARVLITGNERTKEESIRRALVLNEGTLLKSNNIYLSEQNLYESDVFSLVEIKPQPAGDRPGGGRNVDIIVNVTEQASRIATYGGGFSTDVGWSGFADLRHLNLFGRLWQGGARISWSQRQQIIQFDFVDPRFLREKENRFSPLTISAQYQRDSTVTRFFRSAFDRGTFGIVQRIDDEGNPIDEFGAPAGDPTLNRLTLSAETNRTISKKARSILYVRYKFEDARLFDIQSLLIKELLVPDSKIRTSGFGATFVRDTRQNCMSRMTVLDRIAKGEEETPCRYSASDPTHGDYLTADYNVSLPALGANIGFNKFQASYNFFRTFPRFRNTTFAARGILGLASVFKENTRFGAPNFPGLEKILPISERFFGGGSTTLRGFSFEEAGPRVVVTPQGTFRNSDGEIVSLDPFSVPFGGNALAVVNLEARMPVSKSIRLVPFYDGGNIFRRVGDIFKKPQVADTDYFQRNLIATWTHTLGLGMRLKTPVGGEFAVDYGYLLNPPSFFIPQTMGPPAILKLSPSRFHFRFSQAF